MGRAGSVCVTRREIKTHSSCFSLWEQSRPCQSELLPPLVACVCRAFLSSSHGSGHPVGPCLLPMCPLSHRRIIWCFYFGMLDRTPTKPIICCVTNHCQPWWLKITTVFSSRLFLGVSHLGWAQLWPFWFRPNRLLPPQAHRVQVDSDLLVGQPALGHVAGGSRARRVTWQVGHVPGGHVAGMSRGGGSRGGSMPWAELRLQGFLPPELRTCTVGLLPLSLRESKSHACPRNKEDTEEGTHSSW